MPLARLVFDHQGSRAAVFKRIRSRLPECLQVQCRFENVIFVPENYRSGHHSGTGRFAVCVAKCIAYCLGGAISVRKKQLTI